jgi:hypothetical protein
LLTSFRLSRGTPVAALIVVGPGIEVKAVESDPLGADRDHGQGGAHVAIEAVLVHAEIAGCIAESNESRRRDRGQPVRIFDTHQTTFANAVVPVV